MAAFALLAKMLCKFKFKLCCNSWTISRIGIDYHFLIARTCVELRLKHCKLNIAHIINRVSVRNSNNCIKHLKKIMNTFCRRCKSYRLQNESIKRQRINVILIQKLRLLTQTFSNTLMSMNQVSHILEHFSANFMTITSVFENVCKFTLTRTFVYDTFVFWHVAIYDFKKSLISYMLYVQK